MNVGIIGNGVMGQRWAKSLGGCELLGVADVGEADRIIKSTLIDVVIVCTPIDSLARFTVEALQHGKHVLVEKPGAHDRDELQAMKDVEKESGHHVRVGFNLRYHRAFRKAFEIVDQIGSIMYVRARYGHGGRPGYGKEWRMQKGAGELLDQGSHLIDLAGAFLESRFEEVDASLLNCYWDDAQADDNAFLVLRAADGKLAFLHASCTEWKNLFSFEVFGREGKLEVSGLGGSYGTERLTLYKKTIEGEPPETTTWEYPMADDSLEQEMKAFLRDIWADHTPVPGLAEAEAVLRVVEETRS